MGNGNSSHSNRQDPTIGAREIDREQSYIIYQGQDNLQYEKYVVTNDGSSEFQNSYQFRINNKHNQLVDVIYAGPQHNQFGCTLRTKYDVVTQRIPYRLSHLPTQQPYNSIILLRVALQGFRDVFKYHGLISVKDTMIGITPKNRVKVWLNPNFSLNRPEQKSLSLQKLDPKDHEREMVHNIFDLVSSKAEQQILWIDLIHRRQINDPRTFDQALHLVQNFIESKGLRIFDQLRNPFNKPLYEPREQNIHDQHAPPTYDRPLPLRIPIQAANGAPKIISSSLASGAAQTPYFGRQPSFFNTVIANQNRSFRPFEEIQKRMIPNQRRLDYSRPKDSSVNNRISINIQPNLKNASLSKPAVKFANLNHQNTGRNSSVIFNRPYVGPVNIEKQSKTPIKQISSQSESPSYILRLNQQNPSSQQDLEPDLIKNANQTVPVNIDDDSSHKKAALLEKEQVITSTNEQLPTENIIPHSLTVQNPIIQISPQKSNQYTLKSSSYNINVHNVSSQSQIQEQSSPHKISNHQQHPVIQQSQNSINHSYNDSPTLRQSQNSFKFVLKPNTSAKKQDQKSQNLQSLKTALQASLVDSKDIRQEKPSQQQQKKWNGPRLFNTSKPISYREMRQLLLEATNND